jgi:hypothetical protein
MSAPRTGKSTKGDTQMSETNMPDFDNREEEAAYVDSHFFELWKEGQPVSIIYKRNYNKPMQVRLDEEADQDLEQLAAEGSKSALSRRKPTDAPHNEEE